MSDTATLNESVVQSIRSACERLSLDYCYHADRKEMVAWSELFAEDGEIVLFGASHVGRAAILASVQGAADTQSVHAVSNFRIDVISATEAVGLVYIVAYVTPKKNGVGTMTRIAPMVVGQYEDRYRKTAEGWRFARRAFVPLIVAES